ncbi:MAG: polysaccharide export protein [Candidatus Omnitrophica bacterium]|nr:polysaccharide export protein [Candidatus Omnitrophota bacterium]
MRKFLVLTMVLLTILVFSKAINAQAPTDRTAPAKDAVAEKIKNLKEPVIVREEAKAKEPVVAQAITSQVPPAQITTLEAPAKIKALTMPEQSLGEVKAPAAPVAVAEAVKPQEAASTEYVTGVDDVLDISIISPDQMLNTVTVASDGSINFPYIGNVIVKGLTLAQVQDLVQKRLADGYMKYPIVSVALRESRSRKFFVYGEVNRPGPYLADESTTVIKAISFAGGFTKYGSSSRVKILRQKKDGSGYDAVKINISAAMSGNPKADPVIQPGDIIVVSEGIF